MDEQILSGPEFAGDPALPPPPREPLDRRAFGKLGLLAAVIGSGSGALTQVFGPAPAEASPQRLVSAGGLPSHLTSLDFADADAFVPWSWGAGQAFSGGVVDNTLADLDAFITANLSLLRTSRIPRVFAQRERAGNLPQTIRDLVDAFIEGLRVQPQAAVSSAGSLCIEGPDGCIDTGCEDLGGYCWDVPAALVEFLGLEPCECVYKPKWYEVALLALVLLLLIATPGPDELAAIAAAASRLIIRAAPAIP